MCQNFRLVIIRDRRRNHCPSSIARRRRYGKSCLQRGTREKRACWALKKMAWHTALKALGSSGISCQDGLRWRGVVSLAAKRDFLYIVFSIYPWTAFLSNDMKRWDFGTLLAFMSLYSLT